MPDLTTLLVFSAAALVLIAVPGPNIIYIVTRGISEGRKAAMASALGVETGGMLHVAAAAAGLSVLLASSAVAFDVVKYLGAAYLIYLGLRALFGGDDDALPPEASRETGRLWRAYLRGILVNALNPKVGLFFLAFLPQFVDPSAGAAATQIFVLGAIFLFFGFCIDMLYAAASGSLGSWLRRRPTFMRRQRYLAGTVYIALGTAAALSGTGRQRS